LLEFIGVEGDRVNFAWVSAAEGGRFADLVKKITERVEKIGPHEGLLKKRIEV
jgi:coenzyme F420-reducing hydrogenase delta subunit